MASCPWSCARCPLQPGQAFRVQLGVGPPGNLTEGLPQVSGAGGVCCGPRVQYRSQDGSQAGAAGQARDANLFSLQGKKKMELEGWTWGPGEGVPQTGSPMTPEMKLRLPAPPKERGGHSGHHRGETGCSILFLSLFAFLFFYFEPGSCLDTELPRLPRLRLTILLPQLAQ